VTDNNKLTFFFDESRFGTHSKIGHGWFKKGERTAVKIKLGFKNFYIYSAVEPRTGYSFSLKLPHVDSACLNAFLDEMSKEIAEKEAVIIMDGASWHKAKNLKIPKNITIKYLPPYSPELSPVKKLWPVERLWLYIKQNTIKNKIYENIDMLEDAVCDFIKNLQEKQIKTICNYNYWCS